jgi:hypothetical protein
MHSPACETKHPSHKGTAWVAKLPTNPLGKSAATFLFWPDGVQHLATTTTTRLQAGRAQLQRPQQPAAHLLGAPPCCSRAHRTSLPPEDAKSWVALGDSLSCPVHARSLSKAVAPSVLSLKAARPLPASHPAATAWWYKVWSPDRRCRGPQLAWVIEQNKTARPCTDAKPPQRGIEPRSPA